MRELLEQVFFCPDSRNMVVGFGIGEMLEMLLISGVISAATYSSNVC